MFSRLLFCVFLLLFFTKCQTENKETNSLPAITSNQNWPDTMGWWKANNLRLIQMNLPAYEGATIHADSIVEDLTYHGANTLMINAAGIMAYYETELPFHYTNPYMQPGMLKRIIDECHANNIKVIVRFDFSRAHESIFAKHPDWFYLSSAGERMINTDMYVVSINAPYVQERAMDIVAEVIEKFPIDGIFINMPGYHTANHYAGTYHGIDQNAYDKNRFREYSGGMELPLHENNDDPVFRKYEEFKAFTMTDWLRKMHETVKSRNDQIAICTYESNYVDIMRHESQTRALPHFPYNSSDNVNSTKTSYPNKIVSNASIQQISFQSRYNAIEPEEITIRLYENIAHGSGLDISLMGDMRGYEDERNFPAVKKLYEHHKKYEPYYGKYESPATVALISPGYWPGGDPMQEGRGIQLMLKEAHIQFDIIESEQLVPIKERLSQYKVIILPEITNLDEAGISLLKEALLNGTQLIATNETLTNDPESLKDLFGATPVESPFDGTGNYLNPEDKSIFKSFEGQSMVHWRFNLSQMDFTGADKTYLPILAKGRPGPPEKIGGHDPTGFFAMGLKRHGDGKAVLIPGHIGKLYYLYGYEQHKQILLDVLDHLYPQSHELIETNVHERVEVVLQNYIENIPENVSKTESDGKILHLINITGFSGNTYFDPIPVAQLFFKIKCEFPPQMVYSMVKEKSLPFEYDDGFLSFTLEELSDFDGIVIKK